MPIHFVKPFKTSSESRILILTAGNATEITYLRAFIEHFELPADRITVRQPPQCDPLEIVKSAVAEMAYANFHRSCGKTGYTEVWCVFDRDKQSSYDEAIALGKAYDEIHLVPSNPCFELFLLHHFTNRRQAFIEKGALDSEPTVIQTVEPNGYIKEVTTTYWLPASPTKCCLNALKQYVQGDLKNLEHPEQFFTGKRFQKAILADFPVQPDLPEDVCWTLFPELLIRLLALKYSAEEIQRILEGEEDPTSPTEPPLPTPVSKELIENVDTLKKRVRRLVELSGNLCSAVRKERVTVFNSALATAKNILHLVPPEESRLMALAQAITKDIKLFQPLLQKPGNKDAVEEVKRMLAECEQLVAAVAKVARGTQATSHQLP